jgi:hypothetical protein
MLEFLPQASNCKALLEFFNDFVDGWSHIESLYEDRARR